MCDSLSSPSLPLPFPITRTRKPSLMGFTISTSNPIIKPFLFTNHHAAAKRSSNSNSSSNSDPRFYSELGFKDGSPSISELGLNLEGQDKGDEEEETLQIESRKEKSKVVNRRQQFMRRSSLIAKQVISIHSALSLGFVSQLWVDTASVRYLFFWATFLSLSLFLLFSICGHKGQITCKMCFYILKKRKEKPIQQTM